MRSTVPLRVIHAALVFLLAAALSGCVRRYKPPTANQASRDSSRSDVATRAAGREAQGARHSQRAPSVQLGGGLPARGGSAHGCRSDSSGRLRRCPWRLHSATSKYSSCRRATRSRSPIKTWRATTAETQPAIAPALGRSRAIVRSTRREWSTRPFGSRMGTARRRFGLCLEWARPIWCSTTIARVACVRRRVSSRSRNLTVPSRMRDALRRRRRNSSNALRRSRAHKRPRAPVRAPLAFWFAALPPQRGIESVASSPMTYKRIQCIPM